MEQACSTQADLKRILPRESNRALDAILSLLKERQVQTVVAGLPLGAMQQRTPQCLEVEKFCRRIERRFTVTIRYVDEYLSSLEAEQKAGKKTTRVDDLAAEIILKRFLSMEGL